MIKKSLFFPNRTKESMKCESNSQEIFHRTWQDNSKIDKGEEIIKNKQTALTSVAQ